jgi:hypothetical protein
MTSSVTRKPHTAKTQALADLNSQESVSTALLLTTLGAIVYGEVNRKLGCAVFFLGAVYHLFVKFWFAFTAFNDDAQAVVRNRRVLYTGLLILFGLLTILYVVIFIVMVINA